MSPRRESPYHSESPIYQVDLSSPDPRRKENNPEFESKEDIFKLGFVGLGFSDPRCPKKSIHYHQIMIEITNENKVKWKLSKILSKRKWDFEKVSLSVGWIRIPTPVARRRHLFSIQFIELGKFIVPK